MQLLGDLHHGQFLVDMRMDIFATAAHKRRKQIKFSHCLYRIGQFFYCIKYEVPYMLKNGGCNIVNTLSINSVRVTPGGVSYGASKYGAYGLTQAAAMDYAKQNIRSNAIDPGPTKTPMIELSAATHPELIDYLESTIPDGRMSESIEPANAALYLLSDMSKHVTGQLLLVEGGQSCNM